MKYFLYLALPFYFLDQLTKYLVVRSIAFGDSITVIPGFFDLVHVVNTGAAFGMLQNKSFFFISLAFVALGVLIFLKIRGSFNTRIESVAWALLISGVAGNLTDRLLRGSVVDFLDVTLPFYGHWPAFNVADSCICVAAVIWIWLSLFSGDKATETK